MQIIFDAICPAGTTCPTLVDQSQPAVKQLTACDMPPHVNGLIFGMTFGQVYYQMPGWTE